MSKIFLTAALALPVVLGTALAANASTSPEVSAKPSDKQVYERECAICHGKVGTGTMMLARRLGEDNAVLAERDNLPAAYVKLVVRNGMNSMPAITRVEVTDAELEQIATYLSRNTP